MPYALSPQSKSYIFNRKLYTQNLTKTRKGFQTPLPQTLKPKVSTRNPKPLTPNPAP